MEFRHYLKFISLGNENLYQIAEPIGFDGATFVLEQEAKRYGRDYQFGAISKLEFVNAYSLEVVEPFAINPQGDTSNRLEYGLQWLLYINKTYGFEAKVEYILEKDGVFFSNGMLDFTEKGLTDGYTYFNCKLIQNQIVADVKRRIDDKFNAFSDKNAKEQTITPIQTFNYLKRATPLSQISLWKLPNVMNITLSNNLVVPTLSRHIFNYSNNIIESGVSNTLSFIQDDYNYLNNTQRDLAIQNFGYVRALNDITDGILTFSNIKFNFTPTPLVTSYDVRAYYLITENGVFDYNNKVEVLSETSPTSIDVYFTANVVINRSETLYFWFELDIQQVLSVFAGAVTIQMLSSDINFKAVSTAIDQVIKATRWIDLIKQSTKFTSDLPVDASLFDANGTHYKNVVFNRRMVSQRTDYFYATPKDVLGSITEVNCDYEISDTELFIGHQNDFYVNQEIAVLQILPDVDATQEYNDVNMINKFRYSYKTFEQDRTTQGTDQSFHTDTEWRFLNEQVENFKEIKNDFVRDPIATQQMIDLEITEPTTSTDQDDKIYIENYTELAPNSFGTFGSRLLMRINDGKLEILNRDSDGEASGVDTVINWTTIGVNLGSNFQIIDGENIGNYTVFALTNTLITLIPIAFTPTFEGDGFVRFKYFYTDVAFQTRTNQGFTLIEGLNNANKMPNLAYSIKRNMKYFYNYFATCLMYAKKDIINAYFKSNGLLTTQLTIETEPLTENAPILYTDLPTPLVNATIHNLKLYATFEDINNYLEAYKTTKGFIRCYDYNGKVIRLYAKKLEHTWISNELELNGEEQYSTEFLTIDGTLGNLFVNDAPYNLSGIEDWWKFENDFIQLFDEKSRPLSTKYAFNFVVLNSVTFDTKNELINALLLLNE